MAARAIYGGAAISSDLIDDIMAETGLPRRDAEAQAAEMVGVDHSDLRLPEGERDVIRLALATVGKWRVAVGMGGQTKLLGFDLGEIDVAARWMGISPSERLLSGIGIIERSALKILGDT